MNQSHRDSGTSRNPLPSGLPVLGFLAVAVLWFAFQVAVSLSMPLYGDEVTKVIAAGMILEGGRLYDDIFHHHSPLIFAFVQPIAAVFGTSSLVPFRLASALLLLVGAGAIAWSPLLRGWRNRCLAVGLFLATAGALYNGVSLFRLIYQPVTGYLVVIFLALFALPLLAAARPTRWQSGAAGLATGLAIGTNTGSAASIIVIGVLALTVAFFRGRAAPVHRAVPVGAFAGGVALAFGLGALWLALYGDFRGFLIFNVYFNTEIYADFVGYSPLHALKTVAYFVVDAHPALFALVFGLLALAGGAFLVQRLRDRACGPPAIASVVAGVLGLALIYFNMRGGISWHTGTLAIVAAAFFALVVGSLAAAPPAPVAGPMRGRRVAVAGLVAVGLAGSAVYYATATSSPAGVTVAGRTPTLQGPLAVARDRPMYRFIRRITPPGEPIYAMPFRPQTYLVAERPPASGHFFYLPWQAVYERAPRAGRSIDVCEDLRENRPPVILIIGDSFSGRRIEDFAGCILRIVARRYQRHPQWQSLFVRRDLAGKAGLEEN